jgi:hypothetical protein
MSQSLETVYKKYNVLWSDGELCYAKTATNAQDKSAILVGRGAFAVIPPESEATRCKRESLQISGIGEIKMRKYGDVFAELIREYREAVNYNGT